MRRDDSTKTFGKGDGKCIRCKVRTRFASVSETDDPSTPQKREDLLAKLEELRAQSRRYLSELNRINEEVERLQARVAGLAPEARARGGNAARYPKEQHCAA
jgi:chromosome segregation ATPase